MPEKQKSIHIGIDGNEANCEKRVGSNVYAYELLTALSKLVTPHRFTIYLKDKPLRDMPPQSATWEYRVLKPKKLWTQWRLPLDLYLSRVKPDIFFSPGHYAPRFSPVKTVITILDLAFLHYPSLFLKFERGVTELKSWTEYSLNQSVHAFAISHHTKNDIEKSYHKNASFISVAYPGIDAAVFSPPKPEDVTKVLAHYNVNNPYLLYVGTLQPRKNLERLLKAFETLPPKGNKLELVLAGGTGWLMDEFLIKVSHSKKKHQIRLLGYVPIQDLPALYAGSVASVLVGLEEGFGLPPAEAIACGATVVVSKTGALPEVVGEAGIVVDPYSVTGIRHGIMAALTEPESKRLKRRTIGFNHIKQFRWSVSAEKIVNKLYELALS